MEVHREKILYRKTSFKIYMYNLYLRKCSAGYGSIEDDRTVIENVLCKNRIRKKYSSYFIVQYQCRSTLRTDCRTEKSTLKVYNMCRLLNRCSD